MKNAVGFAFLLAAASFLYAGLSFAQRPVETNANQVESIDPVDTAKAALQSKLANLKRFRGNLGPRHPSVASVEAQIKSTEDALAGISDNGDVTGMSGASGGLPAASQAELVALVISLTDRIERLEQRVRRLEVN